MRKLSQQMISSIVEWEFNSMSVKLSIINRRGKAYHHVLQFIVLVNLIFLKCLSELAWSTLHFPTDTGNSPWAWAHHIQAIRKANGILVMDGWKYCTNLSCFQLMILLYSFFTITYFCYYHTQPEKGQIWNKQELKAGTQGQNIF